jgi:hypothetical protein
MQRVFVYLISLVLSFGSFVARAAGDTKAEQLFAQARAALGGEKNLTKVRGLTASGTYQRTMGNRTLSGDVTIELQLPDKILRTESMNPVGDMTVVTEQGVNGETLLRSQRAVNAPPGAVIRMPPAPSGDAETQAIRNARADFARTAVAFLLASPASMPLDYTYGGEAESDDGKADVVDAKGPGSFALKIFFDKQSHRPLMLSYRGVAPRVVIQTVRGGGPGQGGRGNANTAGTDHAAPAASPAAELVDMTLFVDDYRTVEGVSLPHHFARSIDGKPSEEMTFKTIKLNPSFKPDTFTQKPQ